MRGPSIVIDAHSSLRQLNCFDFLMAGRDTWKSARECKRDYPGIGDVAQIEIDRREPGLRVFGKKLFELGTVLQIADIEAIPLYLGDFGEADRWAWKSRIMVPLSILHERVAIARTQQNAFEIPLLPIRDAVKAHLGVSDVLARHTTRSLDLYADLAGHLKNRGKMHAPKWGPLRNDEPNLAERAEKSGIDAGPLRRFIKTRDKSLLVQSIVILQSLRAAVLRSHGLSDGPIQPGFELKPALISDDPYAPYLSASEIQGKTGISTGALRQAKFRKQIHTIKPFGTPLYSLLDCKRKWPQDFPEEF